MSWQFDHSVNLSSTFVGESSSSVNKTPISYNNNNNNDMISMDDDSGMSKDSSLNKNYSTMKQSEKQHLDNYNQEKNSSPATSTTIAAVSTSTSNTLPEEIATVALISSSSNLIESSKQQQDREFFKKFLQPLASQNHNNNNNNNINTNHININSTNSEGLNDFINRERAGKIIISNNNSGATTMAPSRPINSRLTSASIIDQLLPQSNQAALSWASTYSMPSIFGMNMNYQPDCDSSLIRSSGVSGFASSSFGDGLNLSGISNRTFPEMGETNIDVGGTSRVGDNGSHLIDNFDNQLNISDSSGNLFASESNFMPGKATDYQRPDDTIASNKTYSSVLHNPSQIGLSILQQQQQEQQQQQQQQQQQIHKHQADKLSLFDVRQQQVSSSSSDFLTNLNNQSSLNSADYRQSAPPVPAPSHRQHLNNTQARLLNDFISSASHHHHHQHHNQQPYSLAASRYQQASSMGHANTNTGGNSSSHNPLQARGTPISGRHFGSGSSAVQQRNAGDKIFSAPSSSSTTTTTGNVASKRRNKSPFFATGNLIGDGQHGFKLDSYGSPIANSDSSERFSRKVFVGGLPPDIDEEEIKASFRRFGALIVDWPHKAESKSYFPPKGYAFLLFQEEASVQALIDACFQEEDKLYLCVSSPTIKDKPVQIRPWRLSDTDFVLDSTLALDPRKTVFVGGVPRPLKASELATIMNNLYEGVCYAGIDTDPELKYPKGAGRVAFSNHHSYIAAISARFVHIQHCEIEKRVEVKPYVLDDQFCDECQGSRCGNKFAPFFCANITCLRYFCDNCWSTVHSQAGREYHKPLVKEGGDRPRGAQSFRW